jgi:hypothetical protein
MLDHSFCLPFVPPPRAASRRVEIRALSVDAESLKYAKLLLREKKAIDPATGVTGASAA